MLAFEKWQGLGNDFILVELPSDPSEAAALCDPQRAVALCDRRLGIGADGLLLIGQRDGVRSMVVLNADGSRPEMCGNGLRCVVGYLKNRQPDDAQITIATDAGLRTCEVQRDGSLWQVSAAMGHARFTGEVAFPKAAPLPFLLVDVGNPHAVAFERYGEAALAELGPALSLHQAGGVNVELCQLREDGGIDALVWERGVGRTQACGTGACAVAAAACKQQRSHYDRPIAVHLPGGPLHITVSASDHALTMRGPAKRVFSGRIEG